MAVANLLCQTAIYITLIAASALVVIKIVDVFKKGGN